MGAVVALVNQKGGVGKTTVTLGLASAAAHAGRSVLVVDLDPQASSTWVLGIDPDEVQVSAADVLRDTPAKRAVHETAWSDRVRVLPGSRRLQRRDRGDPRRLRDTLHKLADRFDIVLVDCPPSLGNLTASGLTAADHAVIVVEPSSLGLRGIGAIADLVDDVWDAHNPELDLAGVVVNRVPAVSAEAERRIEELGDIVGRDSVWVPFVPQRVVVSQALAERRPIHAYGVRAADVTFAFDALWAHLSRVTSINRNRP